MLPILYSDTATKTDFTSGNGLGFVKNCLSCTVSEELNGRYELEAEIMSNDRLARSIKPEAFMKALPNVTDDAQIFSIYETDEEKNKIRIHAEHLRYRLSGNVFSEPYSAGTNMTPAQIWEDIQDYLTSEQEFTFTSNITTAAKPTAAINAPIRLGDFLLGKDGSMLDTFRGEYKFDNYNVSFLTARGQTTGICLRCGAGIQGLEYTVLSDKMYTQIAPYARVPSKRGDIYDGEYFLWLAEPVSTGNIALKHDRALSYDFTQDFISMYPDFSMTYGESTPIPTNLSEARSKLLTVTNRYIRQNSAALLEPSLNVNITTNAMAEEIKKCSLGDIVMVYYEPMNTTLSAKITKTVYDVLAERYTTIELGNVRRGIDRYFPSVNAGGV